MRQSSKVQGTKIAQAAKDLNVTSVTIRRYISEFDIQTTTDSNGIKVLPDTALEELKEVRRLKEEGLTNPKVMESLEELRAKSGSQAGAAEKPDKKKAVLKPKKETKTIRARSEEAEEEEESVDDEEEVVEKPRSAPRRVEKKIASTESSESGDGEEIESTELTGEKEGRVKHSLTCQTCSKVFEHMNPKLRDCLDCYRTKRKERRRGGGDRHKTVIQHPIAQQVTSKLASNQQQQQERSQPPAARVREDQEQTNFNVNYNNPPAQAPAPTPTPVYQSATGPTNQPMVGGLMRKVRSYRKAIEDTRQITGSLKRRLERPDLPEGERRWLEQIYAYQLILHQGWRHLSEYRMATQQQGKED